MTLPLTDHQRTVADAELDRQDAAREHLVIALTGAHAYGFPSPDSDLDLKGVHVLPTRALVGLTRPDAHASAMKLVEGVELDYASNEIGQVLAGVLRGFGSYIERILGPWIMRASPDHAELAALVRGALCRRVHAHYRGFAQGQLREAIAAGTPTAKRLLYVLRTALTGTRLLARGELVTDLTALMDEHGFGHARELLAIKQQGERTPLPVEVATRWLAEADGVFELLDRALASSVLPDEPPNVAEIDAWLIALRRRRFD
ncbi:MAG: nucleotidyltransferase domain-containing protein [Nannocystaceae bacterium]